jgi:hypothetical protein
VALPRSASALSIRIRRSSDYASKLNGRSALQSFAVKISLFNFQEI